MYLILVILYTIVCWCVPLWFNRIWDCASWTWVNVSFHRSGNFSAIMSSNMFSDPFFLFSLRDPYNVSISALDVVPEVSNYPHFFLCILNTCTSTGTGIINRVQQLQRIHHETMLNIYYKLLKNSILIPESTGCTLHHRKPLGTCTFFF